MNEVRHIGFAIAVFARVQVEHELNQRPVQPRERSRQDDESGSGDAPGGLEVHAQALADRHMILGLEREPGRLAPAPYLEIRSLVGACGNARMQNIGQAQLQILEFRLQPLQLILDADERLPKLLAGRQQRRAVLGFGLRETHGLGIGIAFGAQPVRLDLHRLAALFDRREPHDVEREAAARQLGGDSGQIGTQQLGIEHDDFLQISKRPDTISDAIPVLTPPRSVRNP